MKPTNNKHTMKKNYCSSDWMSTRKVSRSASRKARVKTSSDCKEFAFASAAPETVRTRTGVGE